MARTKQKVAEPEQVKKPDHFKNNSDIKLFYRFIYDSTLRQESYLLVKKLVDEMTKKQKKTRKKSKASGKSKAKKKIQ